MRPPARPLWRAHDGAAYLGERRAVGEAHGGAFGLDTELLPQLHEIGRDGAVFHLRVEILERRGADRPIAGPQDARGSRSEEHTSELQSHSDLVCRLLLEKKKADK